MSAREWQPGDVAMVTKQTGETYPAVRTRDHRGTDLWVAIGADHWITDGPGIAAGARPLVVIDPESAEQVERLRLTIGGLRGALAINRTDEMQAALREFANPRDPKPEEPQGLGAVVEDASGKKWVYLGDGGSTSVSCWRYAKDDLWRDYCDINAVRVLSEGVTE